MHKSYFASSLALSLLALAGCSSTGATFRSGVGDSMLERAPWVAGVPLPADTRAVAVLPVQWQAGASQPEIFDPSANGDAPLALLLRDVQQYVSAQKLGPSITAPRVAGAVAPDVSFGCPMDGSMDCDPAQQPVTAGRRGSRHRLAVGRPSASWIAELQSRIDSAGMERVLQVTLEIGQYLPRQEGILGKKYVELGRGHRMDLPWLTSVDDAVTVVQLTGAVVDREGKAVRIAAEGMLAKRSPLLVSAINGQSLMRDADIRALREKRRDDLPGSPLVWQNAVDELLRSLTVR